MEFIKNPSKLLRAKVPKKDRAAFDMGRAAMALEVMTQIRVLDTQTVYSTVEVQPIIAALHTLLTDCGFDEEELWRLYDKLSATRRPEWIPVQSDERVPPGNVFAVGPDGVQNLGRIPGLSSADDALGGAQVRVPLASSSEPLRSPSDPSSSEPTEPSEEELQAAYERGKDLGLLDPGGSGTRSPRRFGRSRHARSQ